MKFKVISGFVIIIILIACEKDKNNSWPSGIYLKKVFYHKNIDQVREFHYNNNGQLEKREYIFNNIIGERFEFIRENEELYCILFYDVISPDNYSLVLKDRIYFFYENNRLVKTSYYSSESQQETEYFYDSGVNICKSFSMAQNLFGDTIEIEEYYEYDSGGNIIKIEDFRNDELWSTSYYEYDNGINPYYLVDPINNSFSKIDLISYICPNNPKRNVYVYPGNDTLLIIQYHYEYNIDGYPSLSYESHDSKYDVNDYDSVNTKMYEYYIK